MIQDFISQGTFLKVHFQIVLGQIGSAAFTDIVP